MTEDIELEVKKIVTPEGKKVVIVYDPSEGPPEGSGLPPLSASYIPPDKFERMSNETQSRWIDWFSLEPDERDIVWVYTGGRSKPTIRWTVRHELEHLKVHPEFTGDTAENYILEELEVEKRTGIRVGTRQWLGAVSKRVSDYYNMDFRDAAKLVCQLASKHGPSRLAETARRVLKEGEF